MSELKDLMSGFEKKLKDLTAGDDFQEAKKIIPKFEDLSDAQLKFLEKMKNTLLTLDEKMSILTDYKYHYELAIGGGAVRDLLLNRVDSCNDIDVLFSMNENSFSVTDIDSETAKKLIDESINKKFIDEYDRRICDYPPPLTNH